MIKKIVIFAVLIMGAWAGADAATPAQRRGVAATSATATAAPKTQTTTARAATRTPATKTTATAQKTTTARAATRTPATKTAAKPAASGSKAVSARAASGIAVKGTNVVVAGQNTIVSPECQQKYDGCMDSFCMLENAAGGRCRCSDKNAGYERELAEIEKTDKQSYTMATAGLERIEMGDNADAATKRANAIAASVTDGNNGAKRARMSLLDLAQTNNADASDAGDIFAVSSLTKTIDDMIGDELHNEAHNLCISYMPECQAEIPVLKSLYSQRIKSDCTAYENSVKEERDASEKRLAASQRALREAAMEQIQNSNKWDLGQCTLEFKKCMQTTAGCGVDFSKCTTVVASDNVSTNKSTSKGTSSHFIKGATTNIEISASTWDTLMAKKPLCDSITKSCALVADQVWDSFLRESAPQIKSAELISENDNRQTCISSVSECFQKACRDNIDPSDPEGSYDMCISRPEAMLSVCKVPLNACGIDTSSTANATKNILWRYITARLASMRVDACTNEFKNCLQEDSRCGKDYSQCIGLDITALRELCPMDKLVACQQDGEKLENTSAIDNMLMGIFLNIDNSMLAQCQNFARTKMLEMCGDTATCFIFEDDNALGTESLTSERKDNGNYVIDGLVSYNNITLTRSDDNQTAGKNKGDVKISYKLKNMVADNNSLPEDLEKVKQRVNSTIRGVEQQINNRIAAFMSDPQISMCVNGREMQQITGKTSRTVARFPHIVDTYATVISNSILETAKRNYEAKYAKMLAEAIDASDALKNAVYCNAMGLGGDATSPEAIYAKLMADAKTPQEKIAAAKMAESIAKNIKNNDKTEVLGSLLEQKGNSGVTDVNSYRITISAGTDKSVFEALAKNNSKDDVILDNAGQMIGKRMIRTNYEIGSKTCVITTETMPCVGFEAIYNDESLSVGVSAGASVGSGDTSIGGEVGVNTSTSSRTYSGRFCNEYAEPVVSEQVLHFNAGATSERMASSRANSKTKITTNQTSNNVVNKDLSINLSASMGNIGGNHSTTNVKEAQTVNSGVQQTKKKCKGKDCTSDEKPQVVEKPENPANPPVSPQPAPTTGVHVDPNIGKKPEVVTDNPLGEQGTPVELNGGRSSIPPSMDAIKTRLEDDTPPINRLTPVTPQVQLEKTGIEGYATRSTGRRWQG